MAAQSTAVPAVPTTATAVLEAVQRLAPAIAPRAAEIEAARRLPPDLLDQLVAAGCFRLLVPRAYGGIEAGVPAAIEVFEALARADASVGWTVMIGAGSWCDLAGLPRATFDGLFAGGPT
jgi:alkylation response protein AidB-like acyl-CoA dehydrogenase